MARPAPEVAALSAVINTCKATEPRKAWTYYFGRISAIRAEATRAMEALASPDGGESLGTECLSCGWKSNELTRGFCAECIDDEIGGGDE